MSDEKLEEKNPKSRGLGRGLDALFGDDEDVYPEYDEEENKTISSSRKIISVSQIFPNPHQPRRHFDEEALKELSDSIAEYGLLQPILVRPDPVRENMYEIVAGERRWRASQKAQLHEIPVIIRQLNDEETYQIALVENLQRKDLNPIEEAIGYQKLIEEYDETPESVGKVLGKSRSHIANMIRLLALPNCVQVMVEVGDITMGHARALLGSSDAETTALYIIEKNLSVRDTEKLINEMEGRDTKKRIQPDKNRRKGILAKDADTLALEKEVSDQLGMNVIIDTKKDSHKGTMKIEFGNLDQLDDILQRLAQTPRR